MTRQQLLDRLLNLRDADEDMTLPVLVLVGDPPGASHQVAKNPVCGEITDCVPGKILYGHECAFGLLTARRVP